jgi:hypothetical protein
MTVGRPWSEEDIAKLKSMAGSRPANDIAVELGRSVEATVVVASKLKLSLRTRFHVGRTASGKVPSRFVRDRAPTAAPTDKAGNTH